MGLGFWSFFGNTEEKTKNAADNQDAGGTEGRAQIRDHFSENKRVCCVFTSISETQPPARVPLD